MHALERTGAIDASYRTDYNYNDYVGVDHTEHDHNDDHTPDHHHDNDDDNDDHHHDNDNHHAFNE